MNFNHDVVFLPPLSTFHFLHAISDGIKQVSAPGFPNIHLRTHFTFLLGHLDIWVTKITEIESSVALTYANFISNWLQGKDRRPRSVPQSLPPSPTPPWKQNIQSYWERHDVLRFTLRQVPTPGAQQKLEKESIYCPRLTRGSRSIYKAIA